MMNFEEFKEYVKDNILDYLPKQYEDAQVTINSVVKNNDTVLDGVQILAANSNISPVIYMNQAYENYQNGMEVDKIVGKLADCFIESRTVENSFDVGQLGDYEQMKDKIVCRLVNQEANEQRLSNAPFTPIEDLAVTYHILVSQDQDGMGSIMITNTMQEQYGVDTKTIHEQAFQNMERLDPINFQNLNDVMVGIMTPDIMEQYGVDEEQAKEMVHDMIPAPTEGPEIYCLTTKSKINGAVCIANPNVQEFVAEKLGGDYFILPSSVHETLIVSKAQDMSYEELEDMVQNVNQDMVAPDEILSDHVYQYNAKTHEFSRADRIPKEEHKLTAVQENAKEYEVGEKEQLKEQEPQQHNSPRH